MGKYGRLDPYGSCISCHGTVRCLLHLLIVEHVVVVPAKSIRLCRCKWADSQFLYCRHVVPNRGIISRQSAVYYDCTVYSYIYFSVCASQKKKRCLKNLRRSS